MAIRVEERFVVQAPVEHVWEYLVDPRRVVTCLPGAELGRWWTSAPSAET
jgi:carbon monoxide dehydrogenase subunit G